MATATLSTGALEALRRFARTRPNLESCELCGAALENQHPHLLARGSGQIACSCDACAILFCSQSGARFLRVPRRVVRLAQFDFDTATWDAMMLPIGLAFFLRKADGSAVALYPSPAGAMSSLLDLPRWDDLVCHHPTLMSVEPEVEALLCNRMGERHASFIAPLDVCYRLVGLIRMRWRGLSGGPHVWQAIAEFFEELEHGAMIVREARHA